MKKILHFQPQTSLNGKPSETTQFCNTANHNNYSSIETCTEKHQTKRNPFLGIFYTFLSCLLLTSTAVIVKKISYISPGQLSFVRNAGIFAGSLPFGIYSAKNIFGDPKHRILLVICGTIGATSVYLYIMTYKYLPLVEATVVLSTVPVVTSIIACVYLKEPCGFGQSLCIAITITGIFLCVRLPKLISERGSTRFDFSYLIGLATAACSVVAISVTLVILRKMRHYHFSVPMLYFSFFGMVENAAIDVFSSTFTPPHCGLHQVMYMLIGIFGYIGNWTYMLALQVEAAGIVSVLLSMEIVMAMVFQVIFFNETLDVYNISGAFLVMASVSILGLRNWLLTLPEDSNERKRLKFLLI